MGCSPSLEIAWRLHLPANRPNFPSRSLTYLASQWPVPLGGTVCLPENVLSVTVKPAANVFLDKGLNVTEIVQLLLAARETRACAGLHEVSRVCAGDCDVCDAQRRRSIVSQGHGLRRTAVQSMIGRRARSRTACCGATARHGCAHLFSHSGNMALSWQESRYAIHEDHHL